MGVRIQDDLQRLQESLSSLRIGALTTDFSLLHDLVALAAEKELNLYILDDSYDDTLMLDCILADEQEDPPHHFRGSIPVVFLSSDPKLSFESAIAAALGGFEPGRLIVGIDPGKRPGLAYMSDGRLISVSRAVGPGDAVEKVIRAITAYCPDEVLVRIGNGAPASRDMLIVLLRDEGLPMEIVDEVRTSKLRRMRDEGAAISIAQTQGIPIR